MIRTLTALAAFGLLALPTSAEPPPGFTTGPVIKEYGENAELDGTFKVPPHVVFKVLFDIDKPAAPGEVSRALNTPARFINMHARAGMRPANMHLGVVVHGKASFDLLTDKAYKKRHPDAEANASADLVEALMEENVKIYLCGQTAAAYGIKEDDLIPGVELYLSAMTAHAWLQQQGYTLNPF